MGAAAKRANCGFERGACCQKQHTRYRSVETEGGEGVGELQAAHVRHVEIADDDRDFLARGNGCEGLLRIAADRTLEAGTTQHSLQECESGEIVIE